MLSILSVRVLGDVVPSLCPLVPSGGTKTWFPWSDGVPSMITRAIYRSCPLDLSLFPLGQDVAVFSLVRAVPSVCPLVPYQSGNIKFPLSPAPSLQRREGGLGRMFGECDHEAPEQDRYKRSSTRRERWMSGSTFDPSKGTRLGPAWDSVLRELSDGTWQPWSKVVTAVTPGSGLLVNSVNNLIREGVINGYLIRKGRYSLKGKDTRQIKIHPSILNEKKAQ